MSHWHLAGLFCFSETGIWYVQLRLSSNLHSSASASQVLGLQAHATTRLMISSEGPVVG
jgi:hypothetical protein